MSPRCEAERQSALLGALFAAGTDDEAAAGDLAGAGIAEQHERRRRGLGAYRANATGIAERALAAAYPTLALLVGPQDCAALARALWRASPPRRGDLAQWAQDLPEFIEAQQDLDAWPYLADCARLDAAIQCCEAAADAVLERESLSLLAEQPPEALGLRLLPSVQLLSSHWPVATIHAAHAGASPQGAAAAVLQAAGAAVAARRAEAVVVARSGWRALPTVVDAPVFAWMQALHAGASVAEALSRAGDEFVFDAWLLQALREQWLWKAEARPAVPHATESFERSRGEPT